MRMLTKRDPIARADHRTRKTGEAKMATERDPIPRSDHRTKKTGGMKMLTKGVLAVAGIVVLAGLGVGVYSMRPVGEATDEGGGSEEVGQRVAVVLTPARAARWMRSMLTRAILWRRARPNCFKPTR